MGAHELRPLQKAAADFTGARDKSYLCLRMRMGKSAVALQHSVKGQRTLVVCPVSVAYHWAREVELWRPELSVAVIDGPGKSQGSEDVTVVPYSRIAGLAKAGQLYRPDYFILDEAHYAKNLKAQRTKVTCALMKAARKGIALSGTPIPNRPVELYPMLNAMGASFARRKDEFVLRYCDGRPSQWHPGLDDTGASNLDELRENLSDLMFHSQGGHVPVVPTMFEVEGRISRQEQELIDSVDWTKESPDIPFEALSEIRRWSAEQKIEATVGHVLDCLADMDKVVVFGWHVNVIMSIAEALEAVGIECAVLTGDMTMTQREAEVSRFQTGTARVFLGNIQAAGEGISLAASSHCVFAEFDWKPGSMDQAAARIETAEPGRQTSVDYLVRRGGIDAKLIERILHKRSIITQTLNEDYHNESN